MNLKTAANNLARMIQQCGLVAVDDFFGQKNNPAPGRVIRQMIEDVDLQLNADVATKALAEIERVMGYASEGDEARLKMMAWAGQCARDAQNGIFTPEPPRQGDPLKPGDVLTKVGELPVPLRREDFIAEYKALEEKFFDHVWDLCKHYKVPLHNNVEGLRVHAREGALEILVHTEEDGWKKWNQLPWPERILMLGSAHEILNTLNNSGERILKAIENAKTAIGEWTPPYKRK